VLGITAYAMLNAAKLNALVGPQMTTD